MTQTFFITDKLDLVSIELVKLAKDNGSSDNITIVVVFLKSVEDLSNMELPAEIHAKDQDNQVNNDVVTMVNNNDKEVLYDGITSTSIYVGKDAVDLADQDSSIGDNELRKLSNSSASSSGAASEANSEEMKSNNPFASPDGGK